MKPILPTLSLPLLTMLLMSVSSLAHAEKADTEKPTRIEANQMVYDDVKQVKTFTGNVVLTRGTLLIKAGKVVLTTDPAGYEFAVLYATAGKLASFRQKRDGGPDLWIEGQAERIEYSEKTEISKLFTRAHMQRMDGLKVTDEVNGEFISYDSRAEFYSVNNSNTGESKPGGGRITAIIQPRVDSPAPAAPAKPAVDTNNANSSRSNASKSSAGTATKSNSSKSNSAKDQ